MSEKIKKKINYGFARILVLKSLILAIIVGGVFQLRL